MTYYTFMEIFSIDGFNIDIHGDKVRSFGDTPLQLFLFRNAAGCRVKLVM